jgi:hypothetical protein
MAAMAMRYAWRIASGEGQKNTARTPTMLKL